MADEKQQNIELDGADIFSDWDQLVGGSAPSEKKETDALVFSLDDLATDNGEAHWLEAFQSTNLSDMDLVALRLKRDYVCDFKAEQMAFKEARQIFLMHLPETHKNDLRVAGLSDGQIEDLAKGMLPINWTVHLKYPLAYGGKINQTNLVLIPHHPFHEVLHQFINQQILTDAGVISPAMLYMPVPKSAVYIPFGTGEKADHVVHYDQESLP